MGQVVLGGLRCSTTTIDELLAEVRDRLAGHTPPDPLTVLCVNAHVFNLAWESPHLHAQLNAADVLALDGMSVVWAARRRGATTATRCNMTDAFRAFLTDETLPPTRTLLIGLDAAACARAAAAIEQQRPHLQVVAALDGYRSDADYLAAVAQHGPELVLVGCGTPRSEDLVHAVAAAEGVRVVWHVGGGTLKFLAGDDVEAPAWMRTSGLQWVHRLGRDPRAMWRRYLLGNPRFAWRVSRGQDPPR